MQFVAVGLVVALVLAVATGWLSRRAARAEAVDEARRTTELLARTVAQPAITRGLVTTEAADVDRFDRLVGRAIRDTDVLRVKVWNEQGQIVYSDEPRLIGDRFPLEDDQLTVLAEGGSNAEVSNLARSENAYERPLGRVLEVYTRVESPDGQPLLFEVYYSDDEIARRAERLVTAFRPISVGALLLFLALAAPLVWLLARRLDAAARDRERLLRMAVQASDAERRRIARDLHDGVVQDLAGTSFSLAATAREVAGAGPLERPQLATTLGGLAAGVRRDLRALRSLLVEIYPPDLTGASLAAALDDLLAPVAAGGVAVTLDVADTQRLPEDVVTLVWRVAQECVRNAVRHGHPTRLDVRLSYRPAGTGAGSRVRLEVADDGCGFDPATAPGGEHFGLRGLRDLVGEAGGTLAVSSAPGRGTTVVLEVGAP